MTYTPVGWWDDETHPLSQANMKTLDGGVRDVHTSDYRRGGRVLVGYYNRESDGSTSDNTIVARVPLWAQGFRFFELILTASAAGDSSDMGRCTLRFNTTSLAGNNEQWRWSETWRASGGAGEGGVYENAGEGDFAVASRLGRTRGTGRVLVERNLSSSGWSALTDWGAHASSNATSRTALGNAFGSWNQTVDIDTFYLVAGGAGVDFSSASRLGVYAVARPGFDDDLPGAPEELP